MAFPDPQPGLVVRYAYLWRSEALRGREEGSKDRPCVVVLAVRQEAGRVQVLVAPVTHSPPGTDTAAIEIPAATKRRLGLDGERSWVVVDDLNAFAWPGPDLRPVPGSTGGFAYGYLDRGTAGQVLDQVRELSRRRTLRPTPRT